MVASLGTAGARATDARRGASGRVAAVVDGRRGADPLPLAVSAVRVVEVLWRRGGSGRGPVELMRRPVPLNGERGMAGDAGGSSLTSMAGLKSTIA